MTSTHTPPLMLTWFWIVPELGLASAEVAAMTVNVSVEARLTTPELSANEPARKVTVYVPGASWPLKL